MKRHSWLVIAIGFLVGNGAPATAEVLLSADFAGMTAGQPVGNGGPALGEPDATENCVATIRATPFPTTCLELDDEAGFGTGGVHFAFVGNAEVTSGQVEIAVTLWFEELDGYFLYIREPGTAGSEFTSLEFFDDGSIVAYDATGYVGSVGTYQAGRAIELALFHDLDARTYDIWWDGALAVDDRAHGVVGAGVGGIYVGIGHDIDLDGRLYLDDLLVTTGPFTPTALRAWGDVKAGWR